MSEYLPVGTRINAFTVDVEDYFQVSAFESHIPKHAWAAQPQRVEQNMDRVLALMGAAHGHLLTRSPQ